MKTISKTVTNYLPGRMDLLDLIMNQQQAHQASPNINLKLFSFLVFLTQPKLSLQRLCFSLFHRFIAVSAFSLVLIKGASLAFASEEVLMLQIESDLIGKIENQQEYRDLDQFIDSYYALLPRENIQLAQSSRKTLSALIPRYKVAYTAADSAELAELMDKINEQWELLSNLHTAHFSKEVNIMLDNAYDEKMKVIEVP